MMEVSRRALLQSSLGMWLASACSAAFVADVDRLTPAGQVLLQHVHGAWMRAKGVEPEAFLSCSGCAGMNESALRTRIRRDFLVGDVEEYEGLVLSRTEFAYWAWLGRAA